MGLNPPVPQQDSNWEIRAAVLLSLFFQVLLIFLGPTRKRTSAPLFRLTVWSCYLLADWVADLALGLLLNNMGTIGGNNNDNNNATAGSRSSSPVIFAFWTPLLLLHLGGPDTITAYSVEDNELWNRHLIGLLFELFSACVIIFCSLRGNPLVLATMLMLVAGVIKYGERTYSLYSGSTESLRESILGPPEPNYSRARLMTEFRAKKRAGLPVELSIYDTQQADGLEHWLYVRMLIRRKSLESRAYELFLTFRRLLVDIIISSKERRLSQAFFLRSDTASENTRSAAAAADDNVDDRTIIREAFELMAVELNFMYDMVYTKAAVAHSRAGWVLRCICSGCLISALAVFFFLDKPGHQIQRVDVGITYVLLLGGLALDAAALLIIFFSNRTKVYLEESSRRLRWLAWLRQQVTKRWQTRRRWSGTVSQMNLIRYCLEKPGPYSSSNKGGKWLWLMIVKMLGIEEIVDDFFFIRRVRLKKDDREEERYGCLHRFFRGETLVPKCCRNEDSVAESLLFEFIFRGLKDALHKLKVEQEEERKKAAAQKLKMEQEMKAAAGTGTPEEAMKDEIEAEEDAMPEKDAIAEVCKRRGDGVVKSYKDDIKRAKGTTGGDRRFKVILDSVVNRDLDESMLLWHIATDLCRHKDMPRPLTKDAPRFRAISETLSEYMLYLLIKQPDMLSATTGVGLRPYRDTCAEARQFFASKEAWLGINNKEDGMRRFLLTMDTSSETPVSLKGDESKSVLLDAVILAKELRELDDLMWELVAGVWREMLSFAAVSGRGRTHVRSLNRGGELITFVWLLMQHVGLSDMYEIKKEDRVQLTVHY